MKKQLIVKKLFCVLALICVFVSVFAVDAFAVSSVNTSISPDDDPNLRYIYTNHGTDKPISVWMVSSSEKYYLRFLKNVPAYIVAHEVVGADSTASGYSAATFLTFYDVNFNPVKCYVDMWIYESDGLSYKVVGNVSEYCIGYYCPNIACQQFSGTAVFQDTDRSSLINAVQKNVMQYRYRFELYTAADINDLFKKQTKNNEDAYLGSTSQAFSEILGYHWVSAKYYDLMSQEYSKNIASWNDTASELQARIAELEKLNTDAVKAYDEGKAAAYAEYNAVSGLLDGTVNAVSSTVGYFFDNIKVGTITLGGVLSILIIFLVVVFIIRKVKN